MAAPERFLCDGMLGSLARWMRILGFDAAYAGSQVPDDEVLAWAQNEGRFLVTRDLQLVQRSIRKGIPALLLREGPLEDQLLITLMHGGVQLDPARFFTRCTECGTLLESTTLESVKERVPEGVRSHAKEYRRCPSCGHVYWDGSHVSEMEKRILTLAQRLAGTSADH